MDGRHCKNITECKKAECKKADCKKKECKKEEKKCKSSSSSSSSCEKVCVPKVVYSACLKGGVATLGLSFVVDTPNHDQPPTYSCPAQQGQKISITYTITNTGNVTIRAPVMLYSSINGVNKVACKKLAAGQSVTVTLHHKITACDCKVLTGITGTANAYANLEKKCLVLVSQPVAIQIDNTAVVPPVAGTCCIAIDTALGSFEQQLAEVAAAGSAAIGANFLPIGGVVGITRTGLAVAAINGVADQFRAAINELIALNCNGPCCESTALALRDTAIGIANFIVSAAADANVPYPGTATFNLAAVLAGLVGNDAFPVGTPQLPVVPVAGSLSEQLALILSIACQ